MRKIPLNPVPSKPHIYRCPICGWIAKWPRRCGAIRGFGDTAVGAYASLIARAKERGVPLLP